jgi:hypothetical protein
MPAYYYTPKIFWFPITIDAIRISLKCPNTALTPTPFAIGANVQRLLGVAACRAYPLQFIILHHYPAPLSLS